MAKTVLRMPTFSCPHAARYIRCMRRVKATPEYSSRRALNKVTLLVAPGGVVNSCSTAAAESPVSANRLMIAWLITSSCPAGAALATMMNSGISAVNTWAEITMQRSNPSIRTKRRTLRPRKESITRWDRAVTSSERSDVNHLIEAHRRVSALPPRARYRPPATPPLPPVRVRRAGHGSAVRAHGVVIAHG